MISWGRLKCLKRYFISSEGGRFGLRRSLCTQYSTVHTVLLIVSCYICTQLFIVSHDMVGTGWWGWDSVSFSCTILHIQIILPSSFWLNSGNLTACPSFVLQSSRPLSRVKWFVLYKMGSVGREERSACTWNKVNSPWSLLPFDNQMVIGSWNFSFLTTACTRVDGY